MTGEALRIGALVLGLAVSGCGFFSHERPGEGEKAAQGYAAAAPVIAALATYRTQQGRYPAMLQDLVPTYLAPQDISGLSYKQAGSEYDLSFTYSGPGMNSCTFTPAKPWRCQGYF